MSTVAIEPSTIAAELTVLLPAIAASPSAGTAIINAAVTATTNFFLIVLPPELKISCRARKKT
jgi:hypothetical protein